METVETGPQAAGQDKIDYAKLGSLGALHMAQYFPAAFAGIALPAIFRAEGLPVPDTLAKMQAALDARFRKDAGG